MKGMIFGRNGRNSAVSSRTTLSARALSLLVVVLWGAATAAWAQPNVLLIIVDDLNDYIGVLGGHPQANTPNMDALAAAGTNFTNAQVAAPLCNPSRVSFMTGISPGRTGILDNNDKPWRSFVPQAVTLNKAFKDAGYDTYGYGKIYHGGTLPNQDAENPNNWDNYISKPSRPQPPANQIPLNGLSEITLGGIGGGDWGELDMDETLWDDYQIATWASGFISGRTSSDPNPFFVAVGISFPHSPWYVPPAYYDMINGGNTNTIQIPSDLPGFPADDLDDVGSKAIAKAKPVEVWEPLLTNSTKIKEGIHGYLAAVKFADTQIGRVLDALNNNPAVADNTIVVLISDNGYHLSEKRTWQKNKLWEEDNRVPMMISLPTSVIPNPPAQVSESVSVSSIFTTLLELTGIPLPVYSPSDPVHRLDFASLVPLLSNASGQWNDVSPSFGRAEDITIRTNQYRFTWYVNNFNELYDHSTDPHEWTNVAGLSQHSQLIANFNADAQNYLAGNHPQFGGMTTGGTAQFGDFVWNDANSDGIQNGGENGVGGVTVQLLDCSNNVINSTTTAANGSYLFSGLAAGDYKIGFVLPSGYDFAPQGVGGNPAVDSDADATTGRTICTTLSAGQTNMNLDAGIVPQAGSGTGSIGDFVWNDANGNGIQNGSETGIAGVTVTLRDCSGNTITSTSTGSGGSYQFTGLAAGGYTLQFLPPSGFTITLQGQGGDTALDSDADPATGLTGCVTVAQDQVLQDVDAGMVPQSGSGTAQIGDRVWQDTDGDGVQDGGEPGLAGVSVELQNCSGAVLATTLTDASGNYLFTNLDADSYQVHYVLPANFVFSPRFAGSGGQDSDPFPNTGTTKCKAQNAGQIRLGIDAGMVPDSGPPQGSAQIGDYVWEDLNGDGIQDANEPGFAGIAVDLRDCSNTTLATQTTAGDGSYLFDNLAVGSYIIRFNLPSGYDFSPRFAGPGGSDSDAKTSNGQTGCKPMAEGQSRLGMDAGMVPQSSSGMARMGDFVWHDLDGDGRQENGEPGRSGVTVRLQNCSGVTLMTAVTAGDGSYLFDNLAPGSYRLKFVLPSGFSFSPRFVGPGGKDSDANTNNGLTGCKSMGATQARLGLDAGLVSN